MYFEPGLVKDLAPDQFPAGVRIRCELCRKNEASELLERSCAWALAMLAEFRIRSSTPYH